MSTPATDVYCRSCGASLDNTAKYCGACGQHYLGHDSASQPICQNCGAKTKPAEKFCSNCGVSLVNEPPQARPFRSDNQRADFSDYSFSGLSNYYRQEFQSIQASNESYKGKWNWAAFLFGAIWGLTKGLWLPALIAIIGALFTGGIVGVVYWFIFGTRGNYMYYCKQVKRKDMPI